MVAVRIYVEGGGDSPSQKIEFRKGVSSFLEKAGLKGRKPTVIACGGRSFAYRDFCNALDSHRDAVSLLLVDSEAPLPDPMVSKWQFLKTRDGWVKPANAAEDHVYLMVQTMEAWLLADRGQLQAYFSGHFNDKALPSPHTPVESLTKEKMYAVLEKATQPPKNSQKKAYSKGSHSFQLIGLVDPAKVMAACPSAKDLIDHLLKIS